jgi:flagellar FliL protein
MAVDDKDNEKPLELDNSAKKKKLIIIIAGVIVLVAVGIGAFLFMGNDDNLSQAELDAALENGEMTTAESADDTAATTESAYYVPMPRPFRFNVPGTSRDRFVEIRVQLLTRGSDNEEAAKKHVPLIESTLLAVFSQSNADNLVTSAGKLSLKQQCLAELQKIMTDIEGRKVVEQVLFTGFVMQ